MKAGGHGEMKFTCISKILPNSHSLNTTDGAAEFQNVSEFKQLLYK